MSSCLRKPDPSILQGKSPPASDAKNIETKSGSNLTRGVMIHDLYHEKNLVELQGTCESIIVRK